MEVLFFADVGPNIGLGHLRRCLALARAFTDERVGCRFFLPDERGRAMVEDRGFPAEPWGDTIPRATMAVVDSYRAGVDFHRSLMSQCAFLIVIDDLSDRPIDANLVVNHNIFAPELHYPGLPDSALLLGTDYALIGSDFVREPALATGHPLEALISFGGTDDGAFAAAAAAALLEAFDDILLHAVVSPLRPASDEWAALRRRHSTRLTVHHGADMAALMKSCNVYVGSPGVQVLEAAAARLHLLPVETSANHTRNGEALRRLGVFSLAVFDAGELVRAFARIRETQPPYLPLSRTSMGEARSVSFAEPWRSLPRRRPARG